METIDLDLTQEDVMIDGVPIIDLDEENTDDVIEICELQEDAIDSGQFDNIYKENKLFGEFLEKCMELDNLGGMLRVINKTLIPIYKGIPDDFKASSAFKKSLDTSLMNLETDPEHKFSHVKNLCDALKKFINKKKVPLITLDTNLKKKHKITKKKRKRKKRARHENNKRHKFMTDIVIDIDDDDEFEVPIVNIDAPVNMSMMTVPIEIAVDHHPNCNIPTIDCNADMSTPKESLNTNNNKNKLYNTNTASDNVQSQEMLIPRSYTVMKDDENSEENIHTIQEKIKYIEDEIIYYKNIVANLEEREVTADTPDSPYLLCEKYKALIVKLYEKLCSLIGEDPVKRRKVRLQPANPRSQLPIKNLENFINDNIGSDGLPHFPDFREVVCCVQEANVEGLLGWSTKEIMTQARALFTYCGKALQRSRQRREWRDMVRLVKQEVDDDPADSDPALFAKLEENKLIAKAKETEILERFSMMDANIATNSSNNFQVENEDKSDSDNEEIDDHYTTAIAKKVTNVMNASTVRHNNSNNGINNSNVINEINTDFCTKKGNNYICEQSEDVSSTTQLEIQNTYQFNPTSTAYDEVTTTSSEPEMNLVIVSVQSIGCKTSVVHKETLDQISSSNISKIKVVKIELDNFEDHTDNNNDAINVSESIKENNSVNNVTNVNTDREKDSEMDNNYNNSSNERNGFKLQTLEDSISSMEPRNRNKINGVDKTDIESNPKLKEPLSDRCSRDGTNNTDSFISQNSCNNTEDLQVKLKIIDANLQSSEEVSIKEEPKSNILNDLEELGDNFTTTIFDFLDPFLVIEISSDSSSEDEIDEQSL